MGVAGGGQIGGRGERISSNDIKRFKSKTCILSCSNNKILNDYLAVNSQPGNFIGPHTHTTHTHTICFDRIQ